MLYIGIPLYRDEIERLFEDADSKLCGMSIIQIALKQKGSELDFHYIDKGVYVFGYEIPDFWKNILGQPTLSIEDSVILILQKKKQWKEEVTKLGLNMTKVTLARMEDEDEIVANPEPFLMEG